MKKLHKYLLENPKLGILLSNIFGSMLGILNYYCYNYISYELLMMLITLILSIISLVVVFFGIEYISKWSSNLYVRYNKLSSNFDITIFILINIFILHTLYQCLYDKIYLSEQIFSLLMIPLILINTLIIGLLILKKMKMLPEK